MSHGESKSESWYELPADFDVADVERCAGCPFNNAEFYWCEHPSLPVERRFDASYDDTIPERCPLRERPVLVSLKVKP